MLEILNTFGSHPFLANLHERERMMLAAGAQPFRLHQDQLLAIEGKPADEFFLIQSGEVAVESARAENGSVRLQRLGPGDVVGWSWLVEPHIWQFSCRALGEVRGIKFDASWLRHLCENDHELGFHLSKHLLRVIASRLTAMRRAYRSAVGNSKEKKGGRIEPAPIVAVAPAG
jgi:CRP/FNR family cyclic AMP-dependent transcriptional regulator